MEDDGIYVRAFQDLPFGLMRSECPETSKKTPPCLHLPEGGGTQLGLDSGELIGTPPLPHKCKHSPVPAGPHMSMVWVTKEYL